MRIKDFEEAGTEVENLKNVFERQLKEIEMEDDYNLRFFYLGCIYAMDSLYSALVSRVDWDEENE